MDHQEVTSLEEKKSGISSTKKRETTYSSPPKDCYSNWQENQGGFNEVNYTDDGDQSRPKEPEPDDDEDVDVPEAVSHKDTRVLISPTTSIPYRWVCHLVTKFSDNERFSGTGFFCTITGSDRKAVVTCAHNLFRSKHNGFATNVKITQGMDQIKAPTLEAKVDKLRVPDQYKKKASPEYDYGLIVFDEKPETAGFGFCCPSDDELKNRIVHTCGYPGDKKEGTLWMAGGLINSTQQNRIFYSNDTFHGQSGSPVWTWYDSNFMLVGIHGYGKKVKNSACRVNKEMIEQIKTWMDEI